MTKRILAVLALALLVTSPAHALLKNVAGQTLSVHIYTTAGADVTSGTTTCYVVTDAGVESAGGAAVHEGHGTWSYAIAQAETNGSHVAMTCTNAAGATVMVQTYTMDAIDTLLSTIHGPGPWAK